MLKLGILGSTRGTNLLPIAEAINQKKLAAQLAVILSNKPQAGILEKAAVLNLPYYFLDPTNRSREIYDEQLSALLMQYHVDIVVLIGYMRILSHAFVRTWHRKIINVHPSLLPLHVGKMDLAVHQAVLQAHEQETGCTVHYVTEEVDAGPILIQKHCMVLPTDTVETLKARVQALEGAALVEALQLLTN
jgi:phosphoribosylglycinamide formyltransferase 1